MNENLHTMTTLPTELGESAAEGMLDVLRRATRGMPVSAYAEGEPPLDWATLAEGGWDGIGVLEDGDGATLRDLVAVTRVWGRSCLQLPLVPSLLARRHSAAAASHDGPVTFALPLPGSGRAYVPFGQLGDDIALATGLGAGQDDLTTVPAGEPDSLGLTARGLLADAPVTDLSPLAAREIAVVLAAEATGAAEQLLDEAIAFAGERQQFGRPIGTFQAVKHQLADAAVAAELAETAVIWAAERAAESFRGAIFAVERCLDIAETAVHVHGGLGFTWEMGLHFPLRQIMLTRELVTALEQRHG
jgi:alkylation response protein AidB-like acyl-CoA dehydrogenase